MGLSGGGSRSRKRARRAKNSTFITHSMREFKRMKLRSLDRMGRSEVAQARDIIVETEREFRRPSKGRGGAVAYKKKEKCMAAMKGLQRAGTHLKWAKQDRPGTDVSKHVKYLRKVRARVEKACPRLAEYFFEFNPDGL